MKIKVGDIVNQDQMDAAPVGIVVTSTYAWDYIVIKTEKGWYRYNGGADCFVEKTPYVPKKVVYVPGQKETVKEKPAAKFKVGDHTTWNQPHQLPPGTILKPATLGKNYYFVTKYGLQCKGFFSWHSVSDNTGLAVIKYLPEGTK